MKTIQQLLNRRSIPGQVGPLKVDGVLGARTVARIEAFQKAVVKVARPDGRIDPGGRTMVMLDTADSFHGSGGVWQMSSKAIDLLGSIEELRLMPYDDQTGKDILSWVQGATIGYGHLIARSDWSRYEKGINTQSARALLAHDLVPYVNCVRTKVKCVLAQNQFDALVIFAFNIGTGAFATSSVLKLVNDPSATTAHASLESAWKAWSKSQGRVMQGLINRRNAEWDIYARNVYRKW